MCLYVRVCKFCVFGANSSLVMCGHSSGTCFVPVSDHYPTITGGNFICVYV